MKWTHFLAVALLGFTLLLGDGLDKQLPPLEGLVRYGYTVRGPVLRIDHNDQKKKITNYWLVTFWAEHEPPLKSPWKLVYGWRKKRKKASQDGERFMQRIEKARKKAS